MSNQTGLSKKVYKFIAKNQGVKAIDLAVNLNTDMGKIYNSLYNLCNTDQIIKEKEVGSKNKYYTVEYKEQQNISPSNLKNAINTIKIAKPHKMDVNSVIASLSQSDREQYFSLIQKGSYYTGSAELLISTYIERLKIEREISNAKS